MSLEQAIADNTAVLIAIRDLLLNSNREVNIPKAPAPVIKAEVSSPEKVKAKEATSSTTNTKLEAEETRALPTEKDAIQCLMQLAKQNRPAAVSILAQFKVKRASEVPEDQRTDFIDAVNIKLKELEGN